MVPTSCRRWPTRLSSPASPQLPRTVQTLGSRTDPRANASASPEGRAQHRRQLARGDGVTTPAPRACDASTGRLRPFTREGCNVDSLREDRDGPPRVPQQPARWTVVERPMTRVEELYAAHFRGLTVQLYAYT